MIKNLARTSALALLLTPRALPAQAGAVTAPAPAAARIAAVPTLVGAVRRLPVADASREGCTRTAFKHWNAGLDLADGCNTRKQ
ncbi:hypothetical protein [Streptomyces litmocidini]|uniref:hypothetical protein n=1 Tax=Streptomyces litmocidini TaxID=67318 RepID=UPI003701D7A4